MNGPSTFTPEFDLNQGNRDSRAILYDKLVFLLTIPIENDYKRIATTIKTKKSNIGG